jgi:hypothetical protein
MVSVTIQSGSAFVTVVMALATVSQEQEKGTTRGSGDGTCSAKNKAIY